MTESCSDEMPAKLETASVNSMTELVEVLLLAI